MEESKIIGGISTEISKAEFTEDPDEAWLDDLLCNLIAMEDRNRENVSKGLMVPDLEFQWSQMAFGHPLPVPECYFGTDIIIVPPQNLDKMELELGKFLKNASTQTYDNTITRDAGTQVRMDPCLKGSHLADGK